MEVQRGDNIGHSSEKIPNIVNNSYRRQNFVFSVNSLDSKKYMTSVGRVGIF